MQLYLGVDGGGSGCRVRLAAPDGTVLAEATGGPANIALDPDGACRNILAATAQALGIAGLDRTTAPGRIIAALGLAGTVAAGAEGWLAARLPFARASIVSDAYTSTLGALGGQDGIVAAMGTGSVFAEWRGDHYRQIGGWGFLLGDEGSGAVLGRRLVELALRAHDGLVPMTPLLADVLARHHGAHGTVAWAIAARPADFATHAPGLFASDDPAAATVLDRAGAEVAASLDRLHAAGALPVVWTGGLGPLWAARLGHRWAQAAPKGSALDGALWLAMRAA
ncbi:BadF/BadG/BcrA/BcrD ATPase family protein [Gemmobacter sp.]|uniref:BadF/BadG/BcrA/BcrD ATPase family protein n=1 Tax=Gemmobacter sp. TaxID=1898957 RepID=UPI002AFE13D9|nr:BadF/BadG/BcrA/BcrD ATPase family protein [Gemmobacter sp.]